MAVHLLLVPPGTGCACPPIAPRGLCRQRRLNAPHMEEVLAPIAFHGILSIRQNQFEMNERTRESETYGAHHFWQVSQRRIFAVRSGIISFSATIYSYLDSNVSHTFSGTKK